MQITTEEYRYKAFGLRIQSDIIIPELFTIKNKIDEIDIQIKKNNLISYQLKLEKKPYFHMVIDNQVLFYIPDVAFFLIKNGDTIQYSPIHNAEDDVIRLYLLGTCMGVILMQRGILPLHGSAIEIDGKVFAFIGESGAGKSTIASAFIKQGYSLVSDDIIPVSLEHDIPYITPSYPQQKLWQESLNHLGMDNKNYRPIYERETKFNVPVETQFSTKPMQLAGIFELSKADNEEIQCDPIGRLTGLNILLQHTYRNFLIPRLGLLEWHFHISTQVISKVDVFKLIRPEKGFTVNKIVSKVMKYIDKEMKFS